MTSILSDDEIKDNAMKRLKKLCENPCSEAFFDNDLNEEQEEWIKRKLPNDPFQQDSNETCSVNPSLDNLTSDEWHTNLIQKYNKLQETIKNNIPSLWDSLEFEISVQKILNIKDCTLPFAGIVLGMPS